eukprot:evm.model.scf_379.8 EVM.evm.TU.scf_379.8   scf_379:54580-57443(+)
MPSRPASLPLRAAPPPHPDPISYIRESIPMAGSPGPRPLCSSARPGVAAGMRAAYADLGPWPSDGQLPLVYSPNYNITFFGVERLHPFDACKFRRVAEGLVAGGVVGRGQFVEPVEAAEEVLRDVHSSGYLKRLHGSKFKVAQVIELYPIVLLPNCVVQSRVMARMRHHVAGTMLAAGLALERGWAVNLGGGMHHARWNEGEGWCPYADIVLAVRRLREASGGAIKRVLVVDLDVHQGNGVERDKLHLGDDDLIILDAYNCDIWPGDGEARGAIDLEVRLHSRTSDAHYLSSVAAALEKAGATLQFDFVFYNAGTDILAGDPLGALNVSEQGVVKRDEMVFEFAARMGVPICMALSGGYSKKSASVITASLSSVLRKYCLSDGQQPVE